MREMLEGVFTALVTPFSQDGVDWEAFGELVEGQIEAGVHGLVPCGTTGESSTLTMEEHDQVVKFVVEKCGGRVPVVAGAGSNSTMEAVARTHSAKEAGVERRKQRGAYNYGWRPVHVSELHRRVASRSETSCELTGACHTSRPSRRTARVEARCHRGPRTR